MELSDGEFRPHNQPSTRGRPTGGYQERLEVGIAYYCLAQSQLEIEEIGEGWISKYMLE